MNFTAFCRDYNIDTAGPEHHHVSHGWIGIHCPFCAGKQNYHMGFHIKQEFFNCWKCGPHSLRDTLERLTGERFNDLWGKYGEGRSTPTSGRKAKRHQKDKELVLPSGFTTSLRFDHRRYLERRNFDVDMLIREWGIRSTTPMAALRDGDIHSNFSNRIFIPMHWNGVLATFQARTLKPRSSKGPGDITIPKYKACPAHMEGRSIRRILYRHPETVSDYGICVEGVTDVWRMGHQAFALLGIGFSEVQIALIAELYKRIILLLDPDPQAQERATKMKVALQAFGVKVDMRELPDGKDPAELTRQETSFLVRALLSI